MKPRAKHIPRRPQDEPIHTRPDGMDFEKRRILVTQMLGSTIPVAHPLFFRDSGIYIHSPADGKIEIVADGTGTDDIKLSGTVTIADVLAIGGDILATYDVSSGLDGITSLLDLYPTLTAGQEYRAGYFRANYRSTTPSNPVVTDFTGIEGVAASYTTEEAITFRGGHFRTYINADATSTMRTAIGMEASARASYSGGTECVAEGGTAFVGARIWMAPYFTSGSLSNLNNFWGLWIYGEHATQRNADSAIKISDAGGGFTADITFQEGTTLTDDGTLLTLDGANLNINMNYIVNVQQLRGCDDHNLNIYANYLTTADTEKDIIFWTLDATGDAWVEVFRLDANSTTPTLKLAKVLNANSQNFTNVGTLNTHTIPGGTDTFAMLAATQVLANKTLTAPTLNGTTTLGATPIFDVGSGNVQINTTGQYTGIIIQNTVDATGGGRLRFNKEDVTRAVGQYLASLDFYGYDGAGTPVLRRYGSFRAKFGNVTDNTEEILYEWIGMTGGVVDQVCMTLTGAGAATLTAGLTLGGALDMGTNLINNVVDPTTNQQAATKKYVDDNVGATKEFLANMHVALNGATSTATGDKPCVRIDADGEQGFWGFYVPADFGSITACVLVIHPRATGTHRVDIRASYGAVGEGVAESSETASDTDMSLTNDETHEEDITGVLSTLAAGDYVGIFVGGKATNIPNIDVIGVRFKYT